MSHIFPRGTRLPMSCDQMVACTISFLGSVLLDQTIIFSKRCYNNEAVFEKRDVNKFIGSHIRNIHIVLILTRVKFLQAGSC